MTLTKLEDAEGNEHMFEIAGNMTERITVSCSTSQDLQEWLEHLQRLTKGTCNTVPKTQSWGAHSENKRMKQCLEEELKSRKDLEKLVRRLLKQTDECGREDTGRKSLIA
ncbi:rho guanine nucleotide exchange factor 6 [Limosa lapponica baueri]|uniref:Rho guanine nucleotide exchange factor 6 n=1 Tax=Limosa lapponica baueri TaxID=1758121 RepID=A0A2I0T9L1_LIMLA|nr:rho guanine nucleotide exchange factor 6 [Limosa lapponica baueri]